MVVTGQALLTKTLCKDARLEQCCVLQFPVCFTIIIQKCYAH